MPKSSKPVVDNSKRISDYVSQFTDWKNDLKRYWGEMDKCQEMYEFYKSKKERKDSSVDISLNTPFSIVESQINKENQTTLRVTVKSKPDDDIGKFTDWIASVLKDAILDPDIAEIYGTFRKTREKWSRSLKITGQAVAEVNYCYRTQVINGEKKVIADNPYTKTRSYKSIIFNPSMQFDNSDIYYVEDFMDMSDLKKQEQKDGSGLYTNLGELKIALKENKNGDLKDDSEVSFISGDTLVSRKNKPIQVITRWEGLKMTVFAITGKDEGVIIREANDPMKLGGHNLILGMRCVVEGRPYAYGVIASIYKPVRAQDTIVAQSIEIVNRYLRGSYIIGSDIGIDEFMMILSNGGAMQGNGESVKNVPVNTPPASAFQSIDVLQQAIERAALYSPYANGQSGQSTDKTQGTKGGINAIQSAAEPNIEVQIDDVQEMFIQPISRKYLKMIGALMGADEIRYGLLEGEDPTWVKATKSMLMGKATLQDMLKVGLLTEEDYQSYTTTMTPVLDQMGQPAVDPMTGEPQMQPTPIPGAEKALIFDVDWIVEAKLDNQSASDKEQKTRAELNHVQWGLQLGIPINAEKAWITLGKRSGFEDIDELLMSEEEQAKKQQEAQAQQQQQMQGQQMQAEQSSQMEMAKQQAQMQHQKELEQMKMQGQMQMQQSRNGLA